MSNLTELMFEVFSSGRLSILQLLNGRNLRFTDLSRQMETSDAELSRNLRRLLDSGLIEKHSSGAFENTPLAKVILTFIPGLEVLTKHMDYFRSHDITHLPKELILHLDSLSEAHCISEPFKIFAAIEQVFSSVEKLFYGLWVFGREFLTREEISHTVRLKESILNNGTEVRSLLLEKELPIFTRAFPELSALVHVRVLKDTPVSLALSDASAIVFFTDRSGRLDFNYAFFGEDEGFLRWCRDLFVWYWDHAQSLPAA